MLPNTCLLPICPEVIHSADDASFFCVSSPSDHHPSFSPLVVYVHSTLHDEKRLRSLLISFRILNLPPHARTDTPACERPNNAFLSYWYPRNLWILSCLATTTTLYPPEVRFFTRCCPTTGSTDTQLTNPFRTSSPPQTIAVFHLSTVHARKYQGPAVQIGLSGFCTRRAVD